MHGKTKVIVVAVELSFMSGTTDKLIHCLKLQITSGKEIVEANCRLMGEGTYNYNDTLAENIKDYYCTEEMPGAGPWDVEVDNIKMSILENNELSNYHMDFGSNSK